MTIKMKQTPLYEWHEQHGAKMASFASYNMPLWYPAGVKEEHLAVVKTAGLFDTSHMAVVRVSKRDARTLLQNCFTKDLERCIGLGKTPLVVGRCVYGLFLDKKGHVIDDAIVFQLAEEDYMVVVNAGMGRIITQHLKTSGRKLNVEVTDHSDRVGKIDIQGPAAAKILSKIVTDAEKIFEKMVYLSFKGQVGPKWGKKSSVILKDGTPLLLSRTGYTGEFGFELFVAPEKMVSVWEKILEAGEGYSILPCGLAARDSLRTGALLPLSHQDIGDWPFVATPWDFALPRDADGGFTKEFIGSMALLALSANDYTYPFVGYDPRKVNKDTESYVTNAKGEPIGAILTCATDMAIGRVNNQIMSVATPYSEGRPQDFLAHGLSCGFVKTDHSLDVGDEVFLTDGKRNIRVEIRKDIRPNRTARTKIQSML